MPDGTTCYTPKKSKVLTREELKSWSPHDPIDATAPKHATQTQVQDIPTGSRANIVRLADVEAISVEWLWNKRIARRSLTIIGGPVGLGKTMVAIDCAARISRGTLWPLSTDEKPSPKSAVILIVAEDDLGQTIRPRIEAANGDPEQIHVIESVVLPDGRAQLFSTRHDTELLRQVISDTGAGVIIIDPVSLFVGRADQNSHGDVYGALAPLAKLAQSENVAVICVHHWNKGGNGTGRAVEKLMGSQAWGAIARNVWVVREDPDDTEGRYRLFCHAKASLSKLQPAIRFQIEEDDLGRPFVGWSEIIDQTADQIEEKAEANRNEGTTGKTGEAVEWLKATLTTSPQSSGELTERAKAEGFSGSTMLRARKKLGVKSQPVKDSNGHITDWLVWLPYSPEGATNAQT